MNVTQRNRRSLRLPAYDYSLPGAYFITVVTHQRLPLFDDPVFQTIVQTVWEEIPAHFPSLTLDAFVVMPNHIHGIVIIKGDDVGAIHELPLRSARVQRRLMLLPKVIGYFKMNSAKRINQHRETPGLAVWQRNYHERVIRDDRELDRIRQYIQDNPTHWDLDNENPNKIQRLG